MIEKHAYLGATLAAIAFVHGRMASANPADLDMHFGIGGLAQTVISEDTTNIGTALLQPDGKIVNEDLIYPADGQGSSVALTRFDADGTLDSGFGVGGIVHTVPTSGDYMLSHISLEPDGNIVLAGYQDDVGSSMLLIRYDGATGQLDPTFGNGGIVTTQFGPNQIITDIVTLPDGSIVAAAVASGMDAFLIKYAPDGTIDTSFGQQGIAYAPQHGIGHVGRLADGRFLVSGDVAVALDVSNPAVARMNEDGSLDTTYGVNGMATIDMQGNYDYDGDLALRPDGSAALLVGQQFAPYSLIIVRLGIDGALDGSFESDDARASHIAFQPDGKLLANAFTPGTGGFPIARYTTDGELDVSFGVGGLSSTAFAGYASTILLQPDGKIIEAGSTGSGSSAVLRLIGDAETIFSDDFE